MASKSTKDEERRLMAALRPLMRHWELVSVEHRVIGPAEATEITAKNKYKGQRNSDDRHIQRLADIMEGAVWTDGDIVIATYRGKDYLINGQHTLAGIGLYGRYVPVTIKRFKVKTLRDLSLLYAQYDTSYGIKMRQLRDAIKALVALEPETFLDSEGDPIPTEMMELFCTGLSVGVKSWGNALLSFNQKIDTALLNTDNFKRCVDIYVTLFKHVKRDVKRCFLRGPVFKVIFDTWGISRDFAKKFWLEAQDGTAMSKPTKMSHKFGKFLFHTITGGGHTFTPPAGFIVLGNRAMHNYCVSYWNAARTRQNEIDASQVDSKNLTAR